MKFSKIYVLVMRQWFLIKGNPTRLASMFLWTIINILMWGFMSKYLGTLGKSTFSLVTVLLGAIILWDFLGRVQQGIMTAFLEDIWSKNFINFFASPMSVREYIAGLVTTSLITSIIGFIITALLAGVLFGYNVLIAGVYLIPFIITLLIFGMAVGIFISGLIFRLGPSAEWIGWPLPFVLSIFAGVYYPVSTMPVTLQMISKMIPASYVFESMRSIVTTGTFSAHLGWNLLIGVLTSLLYLFATYLFFVKIYQRNLESGALARFDAEG